MSGWARERTLKIFAAGAACLALVALAGLRCHAAPGPRLVVAAVRQPATSLFFVAQASGCFRGEGLEVEERTFELGRDALDLLAAGEADVAIAYETPILRSYARDGRLRVLAAIHGSTRNTRVVARRDRGISGVGDLRGKRLGAARGTNADFFVDHLLALGGVPRSAVEVVDLAPEAAPGALASGVVDAAALSDPHAAHARSTLGEGAVEIVTDLYEEYSMAATRAETLAARRDALRAFLRGLACAERLLHTRPAEAYAAVRPRFPDQTDAELAAALGRVTRGLGLDEVLRAVLRREAEWLRERGEGAAPDLSRLVDASLLDEVEPEAVNLVARP